MDFMEFLARPTNMDYHNLLRHNEMPPGTPQLLVHGLNFCVNPASTNDIIRHTFNCLKNLLEEFGHSEAWMTTATIIPPSTSSPTTNLNLLQSILNKLSKPSRQESNKNSYNFNDSAFESLNVICLHWVWTSWSIWRITTSTLLFTVTRILVPAY